MKKLFSIFKLLFFSLIFLGCNSKKKLSLPDFNKPLAVPKIIPIPSGFLKKITEYGPAIDPEYRVRLIGDDTTYYFSALTLQRNKIIAFKIGDTSKLILFDIKLPLNISNDKFNRRYYVIKNKLLYYINCRDRIMYKYAFAKDSFKLIKINKLENLNNTDYSYISPNADVLSNESFIFNYVIAKMSVLNFADDHNLLIYDSLNEFKKIGFYPKRFTKELIPKYFTLFKAISDSECVFTFAMQDEIYKYNFLNNKIVKKNTFNNNFEYPKFDEAKKSDLGYNKHYGMLSGENNLVEVTKNNYIVVTKILSQNDLTKKQYKQYYIFDNNLQVMYSDTIRSEILKDFIGIYKNGFLLIAKEREKFYYYEIEK